MQKTFYYRFKKFDGCLAILILEIIFLCLVGISTSFLWLIMALTIGVWGYKNIVKHPAVIITDTDIKIDFSDPIKWQDIQSAEIKTVRLCNKDKKILALVPKKDIQYRYSYLQKNNCNFGPFPIPLYGVLTPQDEEEIIRLVGKKIKIK